MLFHKDNIVPGCSWETDLHLGMSHISSPTFLISHTSIGGIRLERNRLFIVGMIRVTALACGGCVRNES